MLGFSIIFPVAGISVSVPEGEWESDVMVPPGKSKIDTDEKNIFETIQIINKYLWFSIGAICMWLLIFGGFRLIVAEWDEEVAKKTSTLLIGASVWIAVAMLSYAAVRLIINIL